MDSGLRTQDPGPTTHDFAVSAYGSRSRGVFQGGATERVLLDDASVGVKRLEDLKAWQLARAFKLEVYRLVKSRPEAYRDFRFRSQIFDSAAGNEMNIAE